MSENFNLLFLRLVRFGIVGLSNVVLTFSLFALLVILGVPYTFSIIITGILGVLFSSLLNKSFTFRGKGNHYTVLFIVVYIFTVGLNLLLIDHGVKIYEGDPIVVQGILVLPLAALTFTLLWFVDYYLASKHL